MAETLTDFAARLGVTIPGAVSLELGSPPPRAPRRTRAPSTGRPGGRPRKTHCKNGHDLSETRRFVNGKPKDCRACHNNDARKRSQAMTRVKFIDALRVLATDVDDAPDSEYRDGYAAAIEQVFDLYEEYPR